MNLKEFRASKGLQRKFAVKKLGISGKHLNDIEASRVNLTDRVARKLANFYNVDINTIESMYLEGKMRREEILNRQSKLLKKVDLLSKEKVMQGNVAKITKNTMSKHLI